MIKTGIALVVLIGATVWLPVWVQVILYIVAGIVLRYRLALFVPAVIADALYAPSGIGYISAHRYVLFVVAIILVHYVITTKTRIGQLYAVEK